MAPDLVANRLEPNTAALPVVFAKLNHSQMFWHTWPIVLPADDPITILGAVTVCLEILGFELKFNPNSLGALVSDAVWKTRLNSLDAQTVFFFPNEKTKTQHPARCPARIAKVPDLEVVMDGLGVNCVSFSFVLSNTSAVRNMQNPFLIMHTGAEEATWRQWMFWQYEKWPLRGAIKEGRANHPRHHEIPGGVFVAKSGSFHQGR